MTYVWFALGALCVLSIVNLTLLYLVAKVVVRNSDDINRLKQESNQQQEETGLISP